MAQEQQHEEVGPTRPTLVLVARFGCQFFDPQRKLLSRYASSNGSVSDSIAAAFPHVAPSLHCHRFQDHILSTKS